MKGNVMEELEGKSIYSIKHKLHALKERGLYVCTATHPQQPNYSGHSRGRKVHLSEDYHRGSLTKCNMKVDEVIPKEEAISGGLWHPFNNGVCKVCFSPPHLNKLN